MAARQAEERTARDAEAAARAHQAGALLAKRPLDQQPAPALAAAAPAATPSAAPAAPQPAKAAEQAARVPADTPEHEFERIAQLRAEGRHDEADKAFLEFRRRYPGFRITEEMLRRVERR
jgi:TolA-binding protein